MTQNIHEALFKVQGELRGVKKDAKNPHFRNSYATLEQVTDTIRPHMQAAGLYWIQFPGSVVDGSIEVSTRIVHAATGDGFDFTMQMPLAKRDPQGAGSSMTYAMRYSLMAALGLPPTDDDAETAIDRNNTRPETVVSLKPEYDIAIDPPVKSSAALKRANSWEALQNDLQQDMVDCRTLVALGRVKDIYRKRAVSEGWSPAWKAALKNEFDTYEDAIKKDGEIVRDIEDTFPGARVVNERVYSTLEAGE